MLMDSVGQEFRQSKVVMTCLFHKFWDLLFEDWKSEGVDI